MRSIDTDARGQSVALPDMRHGARSRFAEDGFVLLEGALGAMAQARAEAAFAWSLGHPGPRGGRVLDGVAGAFFQDHAHPDAWPAYMDLAMDPMLVDLVAECLGTQALWFMYEQIWMKEGASTRRTPWHQDLAYVPLGGEHLCTAWINLDAVPAERSLEFVSGSHRGPLYNPTAFDALDPEANLYDDPAWPRLPDIESTRLAWDIRACAVAPGDVLLFHPAILHGGAPTGAGERRRTISLRYFGDDAHCVPRPRTADSHERGAHASSPSTADAMAAMTRQPHSAPFRHAGFPRVRP